MDPSYAQMRAPNGQWMSADALGGNLYIPRIKVAFGPAGTAGDITPDNPLPVYLIARNLTSSGVAPVTGTSTGAQVVGPITPALTRPVMLTIQGNWSGTVIVLRSVDGGVTKLPLTVAGEPYAQFTGPCQEPVWTETEAGASLYLSLPAAGITYRMAN